MKFVLLFIVAIPLLALSSTIGSWVFIVAGGWAFLPPIPLAIWILTDARKGGMRRWWAVGPLLSWYVAIPLYLLRRHRLSWGPLAFFLLAGLLLAVMIPIHLHMNAAAGDVQAIVSAHDIEQLKGGYWWRLTRWGVIHGNETNIVLIGLSDLTGLDRESVRLLDYTNPPPLTFIAWSLLMAILCAVIGLPRIDRSSDGQLAGNQVRA